MSLILRVVIGLVAGLVLGTAISVSHWAWLARVPGFLDPVGTIFVNAIRLAVIPLVVSGLIAGTASAGSPRTMGRLSGRALVIILVLLLLSALFGLAVSLPLFSRLNLDKNTVAALAGNGLHQTVPASYPSVGQWFIDLVPANIFKAAADGALLPLIVVAIVFGLALTQVESQRRAIVVQFFQGIGDAFLVLVSYVIKLAPLGVFALAVPLAARMGIAAVGALVYYIVICGAACVVFTLMSYILRRNCWEVCRSHVSCELHCRRRQLLLPLVHLWLRCRRPTKEYAPGWACRKRSKISFFPSPRRYSVRAHPWPRSSACCFWQSFMEWHSIRRNLRPSS